ncbi:MAG: alpha/beta hydrolase [Desulfobacter sp.]
MFNRNFQRIKTNGIELNAVVEGDGPLVLLLHGFPQCSFLWRHQIDPIIEAGFRVVVPDQRGYGSSDAPNEVSAYNIRELANDIAGIAPALGVDEFIVIGHDWGAVVAWHTALLHETSCKAVMGLSVPYMRSEEPPEATNLPDDQFWYIDYFQEPGVAETEIEGDVRRALLAVYYTISGDSPPGSWIAQCEHPKDSKLLDALLMPENLPSWLNEAELDYYVQVFEKSGFRGPLNWYRNLSVLGEVTPELKMKKVAQPSAFVTGIEDDVLKYPVFQNWMEGMKSFMSDLRFITRIEGAGHWVQVERHKETTREILRFLEMVR